VKVAAEPTALFLACGHKARPRLLKLQRQTHRMNGGTGVLDQIGEKLMVGTAPARARSARPKD
jgi:hypothetical protein